MFIIPWIIITTWISGEIKGNNWLPSNNNSSSYNSDLNYFPWEKFFKPDPKL